MTCADNMELNDAIRLPSLQWHLNEIQVRAGSRLDGLFRPSAAELGDLILYRGYVEAASRREAARLLRGLLAEQHVYGGCIPRRVAYRVYDNLVRYVENQVRVGASSRWLLLQLKDAGFRSEFDKCCDRAKRADLVFRYKSGTSGPLSPPAPTIHVRRSREERMKHFKKAGFSKRATTTLAENFNGVEELREQYASGMLFYTDLLRIPYLGRVTAKEILKFLETSDGELDEQ